MNVQLVGLLAHAELFESSAIATEVAINTMLRSVLVMVFKMSSAGLDALWDDNDATDVWVPQWRRDPVFPIPFLDEDFNIISTPSFGINCSKPNLNLENLKAQLFCCSLSILTSWCITNISFCIVKLLDAQISQTDWLESVADPRGPIRPCPPPILPWHTLWSIDFQEN